MGVKSFSEADNMAAIELWKAGIPVKKIREQLDMSKRGLRNILSYAKKHPEDAAARKSRRSCKPPKISLGSIRKIKRNKIVLCICLVIKLPIKFGFFSVLIIFFLLTGTKFGRRLYIDRPRPEYESLMF
jgi:hypothetical protein